MKTDKRTRDKALANPPAEIILLHGSDHGGIDAAAARLLAGYRLVRLSGDEVKRDPSLLRISGGDLFGGAPAIRIDGGEDGLAKPVEALLGDPAGNVRVVIRAGYLKAASKLRKLVEGSKQAVAISIPAPEGDERVQLARSALSAAGASVTDDACRLLGDRLPADRGAIAREIDKLLLYAGGDPITAELAATAVGDGASETIDRALASAFDGDVAGTCRAWSRLEGDGVTIMQIIRSAGTHARQLSALQAATADGTPAAKVLGGLKPPVFGARKDALLRQTRLWDQDSLIRAIELIDTTELQFKSSGPPAATNVRHLFWALAMRARTLQRSRR